MKFSVLIVIISLCFATFIPPKAASGSDIIRIGITLGLTGKYSEMADTQLKGFKLWEKDINGKGGILGKKVKIMAYDDKSDALSAKALYEKLISKEGVEVVFAPYSSEITEAVSAVTEKYGYPVLASAASADRLWQKGYKYLFGVVSPASKYSVGFLELLVMNELNDVAIIYADDLFSVDIAEGTKKWAERFGLKIALFEGFDKGKANFDELAKKAMLSKAQALIVCGHFEEAVYTRLSLKKIKWFPRALYASVGPSLQAFYNKLGADANHVMSSSMWEHCGGLNPKGCQAFYEAYLKTYGEEPSYHAATAYAAGQILEAAAIKANGFDRNKIRETLSKMETVSILGRYGVDARGMQTKHFNLTIQWQNGKKEIVWPEELRTAKPVLK